MESMVVILLLAAIIVYQQWFFSKQMQTLIDKIMAGNYAAYSQSQVLVNESLKAPMQNGFNIQLPQDEEMDELAQLNAMIKPPL